MAKSIATTTAPKAPKAAKAPKVKPAAAPVAAAPAATEPRPPKQFSAAQVRILKALMPDKQLTKPELVAASNVHTNWIAEYVGTDGEMRSEWVNGKEGGQRKLIPQGLVKISELKDEAAKGERTYQLTAAGKKVAGKL